MIDWMQAVGVDGVLPSGRRGVDAGDCGPITRGS